MHVSLVKSARIRIPLSSEGNAAVYASSGGGKTSFITTMMYDLLLHHTSQNT